MKLTKLKINFEDDRGTIMDILVDNPKEHATIIFTKKGGVRGNHYHKFSEQSDFLLSGSMKLLTQKKGEEIVETILEPNTLVEMEMEESHTFIALEDSTFITFVKGPRGGNEYESDTYRLEEPLHTNYV